jgi:hypothetical protein
MEAEMPDFIRIETHSTRPIKHQGRQLVAFAQSVNLRIPGLHIGLVWNRPVSLLVIDSNGQEQVLQIKDPTRQILWGLAGGILFTWLITRQLRVHKQDKES